MFSQEHTEDPHMYVQVVMYQFSSSSYCFRYLKHKMHILLSSIWLLYFFSLFSRSSNSTSSQHSNSSSHKSHASSSNNGASYNLEYCTSSSSLSPFAANTSSIGGRSCPSSSAKTIVNVGIEDVILSITNSNSKSNSSTSHISASSSCSPRSLITVTKLASSSSNMCSSHNTAKRKRRSSTSLDDRVSEKCFEKECVCVNFSSIFQSLPKRQRLKCPTMNHPPKEAVRKPLQFGLLSKLKKKKKLEYTLKFSSLEEGRMCCHLSNDYAKKKSFH